ncbi:MAG: DUF2306 domain-containing protein [Anaerolineae bacterium]|jgi:uncharacterized membrane protein|nr:DUF2306 domain-containing protein [Anaerolineae bacterium]
MNTSPSRRPRYGFWLMAALALFIAISALAPYITFDPASFNDATARFAAETDWKVVNLYVHIFASGLALVLGIPQFVPGLRNRFRRLHRWTGRLYLLCVLLGGLSALVIVPGIISGLTGMIGLSLLAFLWLFTAWKAYRTIRAGNTEAHRRWMVRNYALTFAAVTLRLWLGVLIMVQIPVLETFYAGNFDALFLEAYRPVMWLSWVPNVLVAEWMLQRGQKRVTAAAAVAAR